MHGLTQLIQSKEGWGTFGELIVWGKKNKCSERSAGEGGVETWGDNAVLITLQIRPCFRFTPDSFHMCVVGCFF